MSTFFQSLPTLPPEEPIMITADLSSKERLIAWDFPSEVPATASSAISSTIQPLRVLTRDRQSVAASLLRRLERKREKERKRGHQPISSFG
jgi:hypothetical protein